MKIYISGISGTGMGPLAEMAKDAGITVVGSDKQRGAIAEELEAANIDFEIGSQDGSFLEKHLDADWFVYTSALPENHPELALAKEKGIKTSKRDEFIAFLVKKLNLKMVAVAGTHGKTTTTSMLIWASKELKIKASYLVGTTLNFAKSGKYSENDEFLIYEADEYDRNFLSFNPWLSLITFVSYDHPDIYPTERDYKDAFKAFEEKSENVIFGSPSAAPDSLEYLTEKNIPTKVIIDTNSEITLAGKARREDATLALNALKKMNPELGEAEIIKVLNSFPGVGRRFEKLEDGIYSDYGHHPEEIKATVELAKEEAERTGKRGIIALYEPHQNTRQHEVKDGYKNAFLGVDKLFWLPTYLTRENPDLEILKPEDFIADLENKENAEPADLNNELAEKIKKYQEENYLILLMTAGPADEWLRNVIK
ncbi:MAG: Mur ligase domain-containing protein [Candidatus Saccharibacteria bacterium]|nr:Mur ligase domain-containing protein [Candidatus Saccharibacteria bacterium]